MTKNLLMIFLGLFLTASAFAKSKTCKDLPQKDEMHGQKACVYYFNTIQRAYQEALGENSEDASHLARSLPSKKSETSANNVTVEYDPKSRSRYVINLRYPGGETVWTLLRSANKVTIVFDYYPD